MHTTNYFDTFLLIADDCPISVGEIPLHKGDKQTVANQQFDIIPDNALEINCKKIILHISFSTQFTVLYAA